MLFSSQASIDLSDSVSIGTQQEECTILNRSHKVHNKKKNSNHWHDVND